MKRIFYKERRYREYCPNTLEGFVAVNSSTRAGHINISKFSGIRLFSLSFFALFVLFGLFAEPTIAQNSISIGDIEIDPPTLHALGFNLPIVSGDDDYDAVVRVDYRKQGTDTWSRGMNLMRVRPEFASKQREEAFAGSIIGLVPGTIYEVRFSISDPDGGGRVITETTATKDYPRKEPKNPNIVNVSSGEEFKNAVVNASPGDIIYLGAGTFNTELDRLSNDGTADNPIYIRGESTQKTIYRTSAYIAFHINANHWIIENLTIEGVATPANSIAINVNSGGLHHITVRKCKITGFDRGIMGWRTSLKDFTVYDNHLIGRNTWDQVNNNSTWDDEGIAISGSAISVFNNTLIGFGDAVGMKDAGKENRSMDYHHNDILMTGDDGIELDDAYRNVRVWENRIINSNHGMSKQSNKTDHGGPVYFIRNVMINMRSNPFKPNNGTSGFYVLHNTSIIHEGCMAVSNVGEHANFKVLNNLFHCLSGAGFTWEAHIDEPSSEVDYNGLGSDGGCWFHSANSKDFRSVTGFLDYYRENPPFPFLEHMFLLTDPIFQNPIPITDDHNDFFDVNTSNADVSLHPNSNQWMLAC
jgi:hypothetical protein